MLIQRANLYRLEPSEAQAGHFAKWAGACRTVYNLALDQQKTWRQQHTLSYNQQQNEISDLRGEVDWIKAVPVHTLRMVVRSFDNAYQRFFCALAKGTVEAPRRNVKAKSGLNRSILYQGWSMFATMLRYKLVEHDGGQLVEVDPRNMSQACGKYGTIDRANRQDQATFACLK